MARHPRAPVPAVPASRAFPCMPTPKFPRIGVTSWSGLANFFRFGCKLRVVRLWHRLGPGRPAARGLRGAHPGATSAGRRRGHAVPCPTRPGPGEARSRSRRSPGQGCSPSARVPQHPGPLGRGAEVGEPGPGTAAGNSDAPRLPSGRPGRAQPGQTGVPGAVHQERTDLGRRQSDLGRAWRATPPYALGGVGAQRLRSPPLLGDACPRPASHRGIAEEGAAISINRVRATASNAHSGQTSWWGGIVCYNRRYPWEGGAHGRRYTAPGPTSRRTTLPL
jgi:hypothetical protein